jgi:hypothetical protein
LRTSISSSPIRDVGRSSRLSASSSNLAPLVRVLRASLDGGLGEHPGTLLDLDVDHLLLATGASPSRRCKVIAGVVKCRSRTDWS